MTREEAKVNAMNITGEDVIEDGIIFLSLINEIYNDFESRTCENCKHLEKCLLLDSLRTSTRISLDYGYVDDYMIKYFACNKFERKEDD